MSKGTFILFACFVVLVCMSLIAYLLSTPHTENETLVNLAVYILGGVIVLELLLFFIKYKID
jgi:hypothetical protein